MEENSFSFKGPPPNVGWWVLPGSAPGWEMRYSTSAKPSWFHRKMMLLLLGWKWEPI